MKKIFSLILTVTVCSAVFAVCPNFTDLTSPYLTAYTGNTSNPFAAQGVVNGRHTLITAQGTDPNTGGALNLLPPGESVVIKLGNEQVGAQAEALSYRFTVDVDNAVLLLKFAVVLEDPNHDLMGQPRFVVRVTDSNGNLTEECAEYDVRAGADIPGFQTYQKNAYQTIRWRDWTNVGIDLSRFIGQTVQVQFITYDCAYGAHFGYAYFTASCMSNLLKLEECGSPYQVSAPDGFESYLWDNGEQTRTTTRTETNGSIWCRVTSVTGCEFTLSGYVTTNTSITPPAFIEATICEGESYNANYFNLPPQSAGVHTYYNTFINPNTCDDSQTTELKLTVIQRYNHIKAAICHGSDYTANGFNIIQPAVGVRRDTVFVQSTADCDKYNVLELTINVSLAMPNIIMGDVSPCTGELVTYTFAGSETLTRFEWEFPDNAVVVRGRRTPQVTLYFTDDTPGEIILRGENGCGTGAVPLQIHPRKTHHILLNEEICQGEVFNQYNFNLGRRDSVGYFVYEKHLQSSLGCDSSVVLALNVLPTPVVRIEPKDPVFCNPGEEITLWALTDTMHYAIIPDDNYGCTYIPCGNYDNWYNTLTQTTTTVSYGAFSSPTTHGINNFNTFPSFDGKLVIPNTLFGRAVEELFNQAFKSKNLTEVVIPSTVWNITTKVFADNPLLTCVSIPASVTSIDIDAFDNCPNVVIICYGNSYAHQYARNNNIRFKLIKDCENDVFCLDVDYDTWYNTLTQNDYNVGFSWGNWDDGRLFSGNGTLTGKVVVPELFNGLPARCVWPTGFSNNNNITEIILPSTVTTICNNTFNNCSALTYVTIPASVIEIRMIGAGSDVFNSPNLIIRCYENSFIHQYAIGNNIPFELIEECDNDDDFPFVHIYDCTLDYLWSNGSTDGFITVSPAATTTYTVTVTTQSGCSAQASQLVVVNTNAPIVINDTICRGETYSAYGITKTETGNYSTTIHKDNCDISVTVNLVVNEPTEFHISRSICAGDRFTDYGFDFTLHQEGIFRDTVHFISNSGCDSLVTFALNVLPEKTTVLYDTVCQNTQYNKYGFDTVPPVSGKMSLKHILNTNNSCDSTVILNLVVMPVYVNIISDEDTVGNHYQKYGFDKILTTSGLHSDTLRLNSKFECDSTVILNLNVIEVCIPPSVTVLEREVCQNDTIHLEFTGSAPFELEYAFNGIRQNMTVSGMDTVLVATQAGENLFIVYSLVDDNGCSISESSEQGVVINGTLWATRNIDAFHTFAANPEDAGKFYQWNRRIAWNTTDEYVTGWRNVPPTEIFWEKANVPCPYGWRLPRKTDFERLLNTTYVENEFTIKNGINGRSFTDIGTGNNIFLPASGFRFVNDGRLAATDMGFYWSSTEDTSPGLQNIHYISVLNINTPYPDYENSFAFIRPFFKAGGYSVRCVKDTIIENITVHSGYSQNETLTICENELPYIWRDTVFEIGTTDNTFVFEKQSVFGCDSIVTLELIVKQSPSINILDNIICQNLHLEFSGIAPFYLEYTFNGTKQNITVSGMDTVLIATHSGANLFIVHSLVSANGCSMYNGVEVGGLIWAKSNVDIPNVFAPEAEKSGMFYQWDTNIGWRIDTLLASNGSTVWNENNCSASPFWQDINNPCPIGFRVPSSAEFQNLINAGNVWTSQNGIFGRLFGTGTNQIFLPAYGFRNYQSSGWQPYRSTPQRDFGDGDDDDFDDGGETDQNDTYNDPSYFGFYFSSTSFDNTNAYYLNFSSANIGLQTAIKTNAFSVRCVKELIQEVITVFPIKNEVVFETICKGETGAYQCINCPDFSNLSAGNYFFSDTLETSSGCDSIFTLYLRVNETYNYTIYAEICRGDTYNLYGFNEDKTGFYTQNLRTIHGDCDSIVNLDLNVVDIDVTVQVPEPICADDGEFTLTLNTASEIYTDYEIIFAPKTVPNGYVCFGNQNGKIINKEIVVPIPEKIYPDYYSCKIIFSSDFYSNCGDKTFETVIAVLYPSSIMEQKWDDVIALLNEQSCGYKFVGYQWYQNGYLMVGETKAYIYRPLVFGDKYSVLITREDGTQMFSCPLEAKQPPQDCCAIPTVISPNGKIPLQDKTATVRLITTTGIVLSSYHSTNEITAPAQQGVYLLEISTGKIREVVKIVVK